MYTHYILFRIRYAFEQVYLPTSPPVSVLPMPISQASQAMLCDGRGGARMQASKPIRVPSVQKLQSGGVRGNIPLGDRGAASPPLGLSCSQAPILHRILALTCMRKPLF